MTKRIGNVVIIEASPFQDCARCHKRKETRNVLGDGQQICFHCATSEERNAYAERLFNASLAGKKEMVN